MKVADIIECSFVNGPGLRTVVFFQGCPRHCEGCFNPLTQPSIGPDVTPSSIISQLNKIITLENSLNINGITLSGGDPFFQPKDELVILLKLIKDSFPGLNIWVWTGYNFEDIPNKKALNYIDVIIDGAYMKDKPTTKPYRGSDNQKMWVRNGTKFEVKEK